MARNSVQFQKGLSEAGFEELYGTEAKCRAAAVARRWPDGFECPACGGASHSEISTRGLFQCSACRRQTSPTAGTLFAATKVPLRTWFRAMYHLTQTKQGISSIELARRLGVTQTTAWTIKHKLAQVMLERGAERRLHGRVELDDAYLGGERSGGKRGRGAPGKTPFFAAVAEAGCRHEVIETGSGAAAARTPAFKWVNTALGNIKAAITGTYRSISQKHVPRYLAEFEYRFNRRYDLAAMLPRLTKAAAQTPPMPYRLLKLAEVSA